MINTIILGHALNVLPKLPAESVNCVTCSPPYWSLRDYGVEPVIWDGDKNCKHEWGNPINKKMTGGKESARTGTHKSGVGHFNNNSNFCLKCNAWRGNLGLEPNFELYIKHLCDIFDEVKRVLRKDGTCFVNIGDSYGGSGNASGHTEDTRNLGYKTLEMGATRGNQKTTRQYAKSLLDIPYHFSIGMVSRGWIKRNTIIWYKPNCMPSSADDRFTVDFEYLFFFSKSNKTLFWTNEKTLECVDKKPLGIKGIEGKDWEWRPCPICLGTGFNQNWKVKDKDLVKIKNLHGECEKQGRRIQVGLRNKIPEKQKEICPRCKGSGKVKYSFWTGHDYWFEQQFEEHTSTRWGGTNDSKCKDGGYALPNYKQGVRSHKNDYSPQGRNKRAVWTDTSKYEIIVNDVNGENIFKATNIPHTEIIECFGHWFSNEQNIKGTTWKIPTQPFPEAHFAVYPDELIEIPIKAGCPEFVCKKCGKARVKIYEKGDLKRSGKGHISYGYKGNSKHQKVEKSKISSWSQNFVKDNLIPGMAYEQKFKGYTDCGCNAGWESGIVLDPFIGSGTTAKEALRQRKRFIGIDIKQEYVDMSYRKIAQVQQRIF